MRILTLVLAGCSAAAPPRATPVAPVTAPAAAERWIFRQLRVGRLPIATRTAFELVVDGARASLVELDERAQAGLSMADADRSARWTMIARRTYRGTATITSGALELALDSDGVQPLQLHCAPRSVDAAAPGALRVPSPNRPGDHGCGDRGVWAPAATTPVRALACDAGIADPDDDDDDHRLVFSRPPGLEYATVNDDCAVQGGGLRIMQ